MLRTNIIYDNLIYLLSGLTDANQNFASYNDGLSEQRQSTLILMTEQISAISKMIATERDNARLLTDLSPIEEVVRKMDHEFPDFPYVRHFELLVILILIRKIIDERDDNFDLSTDENADLFKLKRVPRSISERNFYCPDSIDVTLSLLLMDFRDIEKLSSYIENTTIPLSIILHTLTKIGRVDNALVPDQYLIVRSDFDEKPSHVWALLSLHIVKSGKYFHTPYEYLSPPAITARTIDSRKDYQQFNDSLTILSEYNHQRDILDKYLRLYQVIENFMFKYPLVSMERRSSGRPFSIRDFQRMYHKVSVTELNALKDLVKAILPSQHSVGLSFSDYIFSKWTALYPNFISIKSNIDDLLELFGITTGSSSATTYDKITNPPLQVDMLVSFLSQLIYKFRNSIVHNRETEFHLTHETLLILDQSIKLILEHFLIPVLEEIVFFLVIEQNTITWYNKSTLNLWNEK